MSRFSEKVHAGVDYLINSHRAQKADVEWAHAEARGDETGADAAQNRFNQAVEGVEDAKRRWNGTSE